MPDYQGGTPPLQRQRRRLGLRRVRRADAPAEPKTRTSSSPCRARRCPATAIRWSSSVAPAEAAIGRSSIAGVKAVTGGPAITFPARARRSTFAMAGFAGASIDGPLGGLRNLTNGNEDFLIFKSSNPLALRDNIRQSAAELALGAHIIDDVSIDVSNCPGVVAPGGDRSSSTRRDGAHGPLDGRDDRAALARGRAVLQGRDPERRGRELDREHHLQAAAAPREGDRQVLLGLTGRLFAHRVRPRANALPVGGRGGRSAGLRRAGSSSSPPSARRATSHDARDRRHVHPAARSPTGRASRSASISAGKSSTRTTRRSPQFTPVGTLLDLTGRAAIPLPAAANVKGSAGERASPPSSRSTRKTGSRTATRSSSRPIRRSTSTLLPPRPRQRRAARSVARQSHGSLRLTWTLSPLNTIVIARSSPGVRCPSRSSISTPWIGTSRRCSRRFAPSRKRFESPRNRSDASRSSAMRTSRGKGVARGDHGLLVRRGALLGGVGLRRFARRLSERAPRRCRACRRSEPQRRARDARGGRSCASRSVASTAAMEVGTTIPIVVDVDASYRPRGLAPNRREEEPAPRGARGRRSGGAGSRRIPASRSAACSPTRRISPACPTGAGRIR